jgi:hypothetical protein
LRAMIACEVDQSVPFAGDDSVARRPSPELHALWSERVRRQADSGLTITSFCDPVDYALLKILVQSIEDPDQNRQSKPRTAFTDSSLWAR